MFLRGFSYFISLQSFCAHQEGLHQKLKELSCLEFDSSRKGHLAAYVLGNHQRVNI